MARPWMLMSTATRSASAWAVLGPAEPITWRRLQLWHSGHGRGACLLLRPGRGHAWSQRRLLSHTRRPHNNATTPLRWRYLASSLARTCDLLMSSLQPWITLTLHWTCPSALRTLWRLAPTAPSPGWRPNSNTMAPPGCPPPSEHLLHPDRVWSDLFALSQQIHRAQTQHRLG